MFTLTTFPLQNYVNCSLAHTSSGEPWCRGRTLCECRLRQRQRRRASSPRQLPQPPSVVVSSLLFWSQNGGLWLTLVLEKCSPCTAKRSASVLYYVHLVLAWCVFWAQNKSAQTKNAQMKSIIHIITSLRTNEGFTLPNKEKSA